MALGTGVFIVAFLMAFSALLVMCALFVNVFVVRDRYAQGILINNFVNVLNNIWNAV